MKHSIFVIKLFALVLATACASAQGGSDTSVYWYDGKKSRSLFVVSDLVAEFGPSPDTSLASGLTPLKKSASKKLVSEAAGVRIWKVDSSVATKAVVKQNQSPVFRDSPSAPALKTLPGGVILILNDNLTADEVDSWLLKEGLTVETRMNIAKYAFFIKTAPGLASLKLANRLVEEDNIHSPAISSATPNWWSKKHKR